MLITFVEEITKQKYKIFLDYKFAFVLYKGEMQLYGIELEEELSDFNYKHIMNVVLYKRAKNRALYLISAKNYTEAMIRQKLKQNLYPETTIDRVLAFLKEYKYINDSVYTKDYIKTYANKKSITFIKQKLALQGIDSDVIKSNIDEMEIDEKNAITSFILKKCNNLGNIDKENEIKIMNALCRKGFHYNDIKHCMECVKMNIIDEINL